MRNDDRSTRLLLLAGFFLGTRPCDARISGSTCLRGVGGGVGAIFAWAPMANVINARDNIALAVHLPRAVMHICVGRRNHSAESKSHERAAYERVVRHVVLHCQKDTNRCWRFDNTCLCHEHEMNSPH